ncbi:MAG: helix-turn-helix transcriptional regulator [Actinomycetota bacterium]
MSEPTFYGITELARATGQRRQTVAQQYRRGGLPPPAAVLDMGPVWVSAEPAVGEWIRGRAEPARRGGCLNEAGQDASPDP